jgi:hypothetical protein
MRPHDHIGWVFTDSDGFAALVRPFLAEGAALGEKLMYVAEDPGPETVTALADVGRPPVLQVASIAEVYGGSGIVDAARQRATFAAALAEAITEGYSGIRVAADNTPLVTDETRLAAWVEWEIVADRFMSEQPVTGLCAFNQDRVDVDRLRHLATLHPLSSADSPIPQFRLFADAGELCVEGEIDSLAISQLQLALGVLPPQTGVLVDLAVARLRGRRTLAGLESLARDGVAVTVQGGPAAIGALRVSDPLADRYLTLSEFQPGDTAQLPPGLPAVVTAEATATLACVGPA